MTYLHKIGILFISTSLLLACAIDPVIESPPVTRITSADLVSATSEEQLFDLYSTLSADLKSATPQTHAAEFALLAEAKSKLSNLITASIKQMLSGAAALETPPNLSFYDTFSPQLDRLKEIDNAKHTTVVAAIQEQKAPIETAIADLKQHLAGFDDTRLKQQVSTLNRLYELSGDAQYLESKKTLIENLQGEVAAVSNREEFDETLAAKLALLKEEKPEDKNVQNKLAAVNSKVFENKFFAALADDKPAEAYELFLKLTETEDFGSIKGHLAETGVLMAEYFSALGHEASTEDKMGDAYDWFLKSKNVQEHLALTINDASFSAYIDKIEQQYEAAMANNQVEFGLGYLNIVKEFVPNHILLRKATRNTTKQVLQRAILQVTTTPFKNSSSGHDYGSNINAKITQYLFTKMPNDVRIIEREQYDAIMREIELSQATGADQANLASVDYIITGSVLEAKVDSQELKGKKTIRVNTGTEQVENPAYKAWLTLLDEAKANTPQPAPVIEQKVVEDVSVTVTKHRKVGIFSVSYRLVDAISGKVVFPDSVTLQHEYEDTSSEGIQLGDFELPFKLAELPSDVEILDKLAAEAAENVGESLANQMKQPELRYEEEGNKSMTEHNPNDAAINFAYAYVLRDFKDLPKDKLRYALMENTAHADLL